MRMFKLRLALIKGEETKFVGHLDFGRALEKALRRAKLPVAYSEGFNPHMKISFGPALAVGVSSCAEYADIEMLESMAIENISKSLRVNLPPGLALKEARWVDSRGSLAALLNIADYSIVFTGWTAHERWLAAESLSRFHSAEQAMHTRRSPKGTRVLDIKTVVVGKMKLDQATTDVLTFSVNMEKASAKPQEVLSVLVEQFDFPNTSGTMTRSGLYHEMGGTKKMPFEI